MCGDCSEDMYGDKITDKWGFLDDRLSGQCNHFHWLNIVHNLLNMTDSLVVTICFMSNAYIKYF